MLVCHTHIITHFLTPHILNIFSAFILTQTIKKINSLY
nr:MAG TPA: hypothetical protein [Caudoviricetes sp.]